MDWLIQVKYTRPYPYEHDLIQNWCPRPTRPYTTIWPTCIIRIDQHKLKTPKILNYLIKPILPTSIYLSINWDDNSKIKDRRWSTSSRKDKRQFKSSKTKLNHQMSQDPLCMMETFLAKNLSFLYLSWSFLPQLS